CMVMLVEPRLLVEVISVTPAMRPNWRSSGAATEVDMVTGSAPGRPALTEMVGKSTCGRGDTGRRRKASTPASTSPIVSRVVATGRFMKGAEMFTNYPPSVPPYQGGRLAPPLIRGGWEGLVSSPSVSPAGQTPGRSPAWCRASGSG